MRVLVSAHRCGGLEDPARADERDNAPAGVRYAAAAGADLAEFDVRPLGDDTLVCCHDASLPGPDGPVELAQLDLTRARRLRPALASYDEVLAAVAETKLLAHVDLKPGADPVDVAARAVELLGAERVLITTGDLAALRVLRAWADRRPVRLGLTVGTSTRGLPWRTQLGARWRQIFPAPLVRASGADAVAVHWLLALLTVLRWAGRAGVPAVVWTVDRPRLLRRLLADPRVWAVTTNHPAQAVRLRDSVRGSVR